MVVGALALTTCSDANLQPLEEWVEYTDNKLDVTGNMCTSRPDEVTFPVKLLIIMDQSGSLQCTDPGNARLSALNTAGAALDPLPNVEFGVIGFASWSRIVPFTPDWATASEALAPASGQGGPATDYQGSLATALTVLEQEMIESGPAENARTRYVVLFLSDGSPEPRCRAGCDDGDTPPDSLYGVCNTTNEIADEDYVDMNTRCPEYNQTNQILAKIQDLVALGEYHGVGDLTLSTVLLFAPEEEIAAVCGDVSVFGYVREEAMPLLVSMAAEGGGTFRDINTSEEIDFLDFDYESLEAPYSLQALYAWNATAIPTEEGLVNDSDGDGLSDALEFDVGLERLSADSDGDGWGDLIEYELSSQGFDGNDASVPASGCSDPTDRDGDGLTGCEEAWLDTSPLLPDTDGDRVPDGLELRLGMDPAVHDTEVDQDLDGRPAGEEVRDGTHPRLFDEGDALADTVRTTVQRSEEQAGGSACYNWNVSNLRLVTPLGAEVDTKGRNRIYFLAQEEPSSAAGRGRMHLACVEARYLGETFKDPASGAIEDLSRYRFVDMATFDPDIHCLEVGEEPAGRPEWSWE